MPATIWLKALGGTWERLGADRVAGVIPEALSLTSNPAGPDTLNFTLRGDRSIPRPDLSAFTPMRVVSSSGIPVWSGAVWEAPSNDGEDPQITVTGRGSQYHLDDDALQRAWVHSKLTDFVDARSMPATNLATFFAAPGVEVGDGLIVITVPNGTVVPAFGCAGVTLDLVQADAKRIVTGWQSSNNDASARLVIRGSASPDPANTTSSEDLIVAPAASSTSRITFTGRYRYLHIFYFRSAGTTYAGDFWWRLNTIQIFRQAAYESGDASVLHADDVLRDLLPFLPLLSSDTSGIDPDNLAAYSIPDFALSGYSTPREIAEAANAFHLWQLFVDALDRLCFRQQPTTPSYVVGGNAEFQDASASSGEDIYNKAVVSGTGPDNQALSVTRTTYDPANPVSLLDRRGRIRTMRLDAAAAMPDTAMQQVGDVFLDAHQFAQFKGSVNLPAGSITEYGTGREVEPIELVGASNKLLHFEDEINPDTGDLGRNGVIAGVSWDEDSDVAVTQVDNQRDNLQVLLARYAALTQRS